MIRTALPLAILTALGTAAVAADAPPPRWDITEACAGQAAANHCPRIESDTRRTLLDRWTALPVEIRATCSQEVEAEGVKSYRKLAACIDDLAFKAFDEQRQTAPRPATTSQ